MIFLNTVLRPGGTATVGGDGELEPNNPAMPVILKATQSTATTDIRGLANIVPSSSGFTPPVEVDVTVTASISGWLDFPLQLFAPLILRNEADGNTPPPVDQPPLRILGRERSEGKSRPEGR